MSEWTHFGYGGSCKCEPHLMPYCVISIEVPAELAHLYLGYRADRRMVEIAGAIYAGTPESYIETFECGSYPRLFIRRKDIADEDLVLARLLQGENQ